MKLEYNLCPLADQLNDSFTEIVGVKGKIVWMPPEKFLNLALVFNVTDTRENSIIHIWRRLSLGLPMDYLVLGIDFNKNKVIFHEGRHRAIVAKELCIEKIPVLIWVQDEDFPTVAKWTEEQHQIVEKADFEQQLSSYKPGLILNSNGRIFRVPHNASLEVILDILNGWPQ